MGQLFCIFVTVKAPTAKHRRRRSLKRVPFVPLRSPAPTPIDYNIMDNESGLCLWVNINRRTLMDGAFDVYDPSAEFCINLYNPNDSTTFWIQSLAFSSVTALAVDFSLYPIQIVMQDHDQGGAVEEFHSESTTDMGSKIYAIDPRYGARLYWYIDSNDDVGLTDDPQLATTFSLREIV
eukprot:Em0007g736a